MPFAPAWRCRRGNGGASSQSTALRAARWAGARRALLRILRREVKHMTKTGTLTLAALGAGSLFLGGCALQVRSDINRTAYHAGQCHSFAFVGAFRTDNPMRDTIANPVN